MNDIELRVEVERLVSENPGEDTVFLVEETQTTARKVRAAIKAIRHDVGLDSPRHVVTYKNRHYMPAALSVQGFDLQPNKRGTSLNAIPGKHEPTESDHIADLKAMFGDRFDHKEVLDRVLSTYMDFVRAEVAYKEATTEAKINTQAADAAFRDTIEEGREVGDANAASSKLHAVEMAWQTLCERKAEAIEIRKGALEIKKLAESKFLGLIHNVGQLEIVFTGDQE